VANAITTRNANATAQNPCLWRRLPTNVLVLHCSLTVSKESLSFRVIRELSSGEEELLVSLSCLQQPVRFGCRGHR